MFANRAFTAILAATALSSVGIAMFDTSMSWLMTRLNPNPLMVSAVQVATMGPMFLLTVPAGALADVADPRRLLIVAQVGVVAVGAVFAGFVTAHMETPAALLATVFLLGAVGALAAPAGRPSCRCSRRGRSSATRSRSNAAYNVSRAIGPALGGLAIAAVSIELPFWVYVAANLILLGVLLWWRAPRKAPETLPAERLVAAMTMACATPEQPRPRRDADPGGRLLSLRQRLLGADAAHREGRDGRRRRTLRPPDGPPRPRLDRRIAGARDAEGAARAGLVGGAGRAWDGSGARSVRRLENARARDGRELYRRRLVDHRPDHDVRLGAGGAAGLGARQGARDLPHRLFRRDDGRKRALGRGRRLKGLPFALFAAAAGAALGLGLTWRWKLETGAAQDLAPSMHWRAPAFVQRLEGDQGPMLTVVEYRIDPRDAANFSR